MYAIYALVDPRDNKPHYVGVTDNVYKRFQAHIWCDGSNPRKDAWIAELKDENKMVTMVTLEEVLLPVAARTREAYWIYHYLHLGMPLTNSVIPAPMHIQEQSTRSNRQSSGRKRRVSVKDIETQNTMATIAMALPRDEAVRELRASGYGKRAIIGSIWGARPGGSQAYKSAVIAYDAIIAQIESEN